MTNKPPAFALDLLARKGLDGYWARVVDGSVEWPDGIDLSYDTLYLRSVAVQQATAT